MLILGPFPPPVHGFSLITARFAELAASAQKVQISNTAVDPKYSKFAYHSLRFLRCLLGCWSILQFRFRDGKIIYIACNGGIGVFYSALQVLVARSARSQIFLHHHSFQYITKKSHLMDFLILCGGNRLNHIFLCNTMRKLFEERYSYVEYRILENSAFVPQQEFNASKAGHDLTIGLLSNLSSEKGLYTFLDILKTAKTSGISVKGILAGPASPNDLAKIQRAIVELGASLVYLGPLYGVGKDAFFEQIDLFVFPTEYINEAQPTVIFEAQSYGRPVISYGVGCIASQLPDNLMAVDTQQKFETVFFEKVQSILANKNELRRLQEETHQHFTKQKYQAEAQLKSLIEGGARPNE